MYLSLIILHFSYSVDILILADISRTGGDTDDEADRDGEIRVDEIAEDQRHDPAIGISYIRVPDHCGYVGLRISSLADD